VSRPSGLVVPLSDFRPLLARLPEEGKNSGFTSSYFILRGEIKTAVHGGARASPNRTLVGSML